MLKQNTYSKIVAVCKYWKFSLLNGVAGVGGVARVRGWRRSIFRVGSVGLESSGVGGMGPKTFMWVSKIHKFWSGSKKWHRLKFCSGSKKRHKNKRLAI